MPLEINSDNLLKSIDKLTTGIDRLEKQLVNTGTQVNAFDRLFGSNKNFDTFIQSVQKLNKVNAQSFERIANGLRQIATAVSLLSNTGDLEKINSLTQNLKKIAQDIAGIKFKSGNQVAVTRQIATFFNSITGLAEVGIDKTKLTAMSNDVLDFIKQFADGVQNVKIDPGAAFTVLKSINIYTDVFRKLEQQFPKTPGPFNLVGQVGNIYQLSKFFTTVNRVFGKVRDVVRESGVNATDLSKIVSSITQIVAFVTDIQNASKTLPFALNIVGQIKQWYQFEKFFGTVGNILKRIGNIMRGFKNTIDAESFTAIVGAISQVSNFVPKILQAAASLPGIFNITGNIKMMLQLGRFFATTRKIIREIIKVTSGVAKENTSEGIKGIRSITTTLLQISQAVPAILKTGSQIDFGNLLQRITKTSAADKQIGNFVKFVTRILKAFKGVPKNIALPDVGGFLKGINKLIRFVNAEEFQKIDKDKLKNFENFAKDTGKAFKGFNGFKLPNISLPNFGGVIDKIIASTRQSGKSAKVELEGTARDIGEGTKQVSSALQGKENLGSTITSSIREANFQIGIISTIKNIAFEIGRLTLAMTNFKRIALEAIKAVGQQLEQFGRNALTVANQINQFSLQGLGQSQAFNIAAEFEQTSSLLSAAGLNEDQLQLAQDFADTIGIQYPLSANQALDAILSLTRAGRSLEEIQFILPNASDLAALAGGDLDAVTNTLIGIAGAFQSFNDEVSGGFENIDVAANLLAAAADVGTASVTSLSEGLANVGPTAASAGLSLEETLAILSQFEDANIRGAEAGTQLRSVLNSLSSNRARDELRRLGVSLYDAQGNIRSLDDVIKDINDAYDRMGLSEAERSLSINQLGDSYARQGLNVLLLNDGYEETIDLMSQSDSAAEKAAQSMNNLKGDVEQLRGSMETLLKDILYPLIRRAFRPLIQVATAFVNTLLTIPDPIKDIASTAIQLVATFASIAGGIVTIVGGLAIFNGVVLQVAASVGLFIVRFLAIVPAIAGFITTMAVAAPVLLIAVTAILSLSSAVSTLYRSVEENIGGAGDAFNSFKDNVSGVFAEVGRIFTTAQHILASLFGSFFNSSIQSRGEEVAGFFQKLSRAFSDIRKTLSGISTSQIRDFIESVSPFIGGILQSFSQISEGFFNIVTGRFQTGVAALQTGAANALSIVTDLVQRLTGLHLGTAVTAFNEGDIQRGLSELFHALVTTIQRLIRENAPRIEEAFNFLLGFVNPFNKAGGLLRILGLDELADRLSAIGNGINAALSTIFTNILRLASGEDIRNIFGETLASGFIEFFNAIESLARPLISIIDQIFSAISGGASNVGDDKNVFGKIFAIDPPQAFADLLKFIAENIIVPFADTLQSISDNLPNIILGFQDFATNLLTSFAPVAPFFAHIAENFQAFFASVQNLFSGNGDIRFVVADFVDGIIQTLDELPLLVGEILSNLGANFQSDFLLNLGNAFSAGDVIAVIRTLINEIGRAIPALFIALGEQFGSSLLIGIGDSLSRSDIAGAIQLVLSEASAAIINIFSNVGLIVQQIFADLATRSADEFTRNLLNGLGALGNDIFRAIGSVLALPIEIVSSVIASLDAVLRTNGGTIVAGILAIAGAVFVLKNNILGIGAQLTQIATQALQFAAIIVIAEAIAAAFSNLASVLRGEQGLFEGILNFFIDLGERLLSLVGLDDEFAGLIASARQATAMLGGIFDAVGVYISSIFRRVFDGFIVSAQDAFHRLERFTNTGNVATDQFFAVGDAIAQSAQLSSTDFFTRLGSALSNPQDLATLQAQLRQASDTIVDEFSNYLSDGGSVASLAAQGLLDDVANTLAESGSLDDAFAILSGNLEQQVQLFSSLDPSRQAENLNVFFNAARSGLESNADALQQFLGYLNTLVESGAITQEQADTYRNQLVPATEEAAQVLEVANRVAVENAAATQSAVDAANAYAYTLDGLAESFSDTSLAADELGTQFRDVVSGLTADEIDLGQLFDLFSQLSPEEAAASFGVFFEAAIRGGVARAGNEEYFQQLQDMINGLRNSAAITSADRRSFLDRLATEAQTASTALDSTIGRVETLKEKLRRAKAEGAAAVFGLGGANNPAKSPGGAGTPPATTPVFDPNASGVDDYITDAEDKINERIADFAHEEAKRIKDDLKEEAQKAKELEELKNGQDKDEIKRLDEFNIETQRREQDHQRKLQEIREDAAETLEDAISTRDAVAARTAIKERDKKLRDDQETYDIETQRRIEDEQRRKAEYEVERAEKIRQAEQDLADLIAKHTEERLEREQEFKFELAKMREENAQKIAEQKAAAAATAAINQATAQDAVKTANTISLAMSQAFANIRNQLAQNAKGGGKGGGGKGGKDAINNPFGWTYDGLEVSGGGGKGKGKGGGTGGFISDAVNNFLGGASGGGGGGGGFINEGVNNFLDAAKKKMPKFETGGYVERTGYAQVDRGELVLNRGAAQQYMAAGGMGGVQINLGGVQVTAAPGMDVNALADAVEQRVVNGVASAFERMNRRKPL